MLPPLDKHVFRGNDWAVLIEGHILRKCSVAADGQLSGYHLIHCNSKNDDISDFGQAVLREAEHSL